MSTNEDRELWLQAQQNCNFDNIINSQIELQINSYIDLTSNPYLIYEVSAIDTAIEHYGLKIDENLNTMEVTSATNAISQAVRHGDPADVQVDEFLQRAIDTALLYKRGLSLNS